MADRLSPERRSALMARIKSKDTVPEKIVRFWLHRHGYRFRLHRKDLPGCPDIVLPKYRTVVFVHGCFWHRHEDCKRTSMPEDNREFWEAKFARTVKRDRQAQDALSASGWRVFVVWECEIRTMALRKENLSRLVSQIAEGGSSNSPSTISLR